MLKQLDLRESNLEVLGRVKMVLANLVRRIDMDLVSLIVNTSLLRVVSIKTGLIHFQDQLYTGISTMKF